MLPEIRIRLITPSKFQISLEFSTKSSQLFFSGKHSLKNQVVRDIYEGPAINHVYKNKEGGGLNIAVTMQTKGGGERQWSKSCKRYLGVPYRSVTYEDNSDVFNTYRRCILNFLLWMLKIRESLRPKLLTLDK